MRGFFITFEGIDGAGKTTQQHLAAQALRKQGYDVLESREPGGTQLAEKVRALVLDPELPLTTATQTLLYLCLLYTSDAADEAFVGSVRCV